MYKNKILNDVVKVVDIYRTKIENIRNEKLSIESTYKGNMYLDKMQDLKDREEQLISETRKKIEKMRTEQLNNFEQEYQKIFSGDSITSDIKLLDTNIGLSQKEIQMLYDRYENNFIMQRAIETYALKNDMNILITNSNIEATREAIGGLFEYALSYKDASNVEYNLIKQEYFIKIDTILGS